MLDLFSQINHLIHKDSLFWFCALVGSGMFIIQFLLSLLGAVDHTDFDGTHGEIDAGQFKWLSKQAITGFLMMFGWVGLTCIKEFELSLPITIGFSLLGGGCSIFITGLLFKMAKKLHSSGTVFNIEDSIGKEATVYQQIPKGGAGKISVSLYNLTHELEAISSHPEDILSFTSVRIIKKWDEKTVVVVPTK